MRETSAVEYNHIVSMSI